MKINIDNIRRQFADLSDEGLLDIDRDDLVDEARKCYDEELARRGLELDAVPPPAAPESGEPDEPPPVVLPYVRNGVGAVRAWIYGTPDLLDFVQTVFHAAELERREFDDGALRAQVLIGDSVVCLDLFDGHELSATSATVAVYVEDVDAAYVVALESGAESIAEPADQPSLERTACVRDASGNIWWISTFFGE